MDKCGNKKKQKQVKETLLYLFWQQGKEHFLKILRMMLEMFSSPYKNTFVYLIIPYSLVNSTILTVRESIQKHFSRQFKNKK